MGPATGSVPTSRGPDGGRGRAHGRSLLGLEPGLVHVSRDGAVSLFPPGLPAGGRVIFVLPPRAAGTRPPGRSLPDGLHRRSAMSRAMNFNAGPAALPLPALERARDELLDFAKSGMSVMEHSHRGKEYEAVHDEAIALLRELLAVPDTHEILFVQGGASQLFAQIPMNLLQTGQDRRLRGHRRLGREGALRGQGRPPRMLGGAVRVAGTTGDGRGQGEALRPRPRSRRGEGRPGRRLPPRHLQRDHPRRAVRGRPGPPFPDTGQGAAGRRHVERLPLAAARRLALRPDLRRRPEEHRPLGRRGGGGLEGADRGRAARTSPRSSSSGPRRRTSRSTTRRPPSASTWSATCSPG